MITQHQKSSQQLINGSNQLGLLLSPLMSDQLLEFLDRLKKWNKTYNLTSIEQPSEMISHHLLDSLSITPWIFGSRILDVGTGAGFPGIPLAIYFPEKHFVLLDSQGKRTRFLTQVIYEMKLKNVEIVQNRVENFLTPRCFDTIVTRAVSDTTHMLRITKHLICPNGKFLFMKGLLVQEELNTIPDVFTLEQIIPLQIPGVEGSRHLMIISPAMRVARDKNNCDQ